MEQGVFMGNANEVQIANAHSLLILKRREMNPIYGWDSHLHLSRTYEKITRIR
jgi:hypothetical protein